MLWLHQFLWSLDLEQSAPNPEKSMGTSIGHPSLHNGSLTSALLERQAKIGRAAVPAFQTLWPNKVDRPSAEENKQLTELAMSSAVLERLHHDLYTQTHTLFKDVV